MPSTPENAPAITKHSTFGPGPSESHVVAAYVETIWSPFSPGLPCPDFQSETQSASTVEATATNSHRVRTTVASFKNQFGIVLARCREIVVHAPFTIDSNSTTGPIAIERGEIVTVGACQLRSATPGSNPPNGRRPDCQSLIIRSQ